MYHHARGLRFTAEWQTFLSYRADVLGHVGHLLSFDFEGSQSPGHRAREARRPFHVAQVGQVRFEEAVD